MSSSESNSLQERIMAEVQARHNWYDRKIGKKAVGLPEFDPVVSILIREMSSAPDHLYENCASEKEFHMWMIANDGSYYAQLLRVAQEIRGAIRQEVWHATERFPDEHENGIYNGAIDDCLEIIESRCERPL